MFRLYLISEKKGIIHGVIHRLSTKVDNLWFNQCTGIIKLWISWGNVGIVRFFYHPTLMLGQKS